MSVNGLRINAYIVHSRESETWTTSFSTSNSEHNWPISPTTQTFLSPGNAFSFWAAATTKAKSMKLIASASTDIHLARRAFCTPHLFPYTLVCSSFCTVTRFLYSQSASSNLRSRAVFFISDSCKMTQLIQDWDRVRINSCGQILLISPAPAKHNDILASSKFVAYKSLTIGSVTPRQSSSR